MSGRSSREPRQSMNANNRSTSERLGRRGFLGALAAALVFDPERALWRPGEKLISIPKPRDLRSEAIARREKALQQYFIATTYVFPKLGKAYEKWPGGDWREVPCPYIIPEDPQAFFGGGA